jgi:hypothetical protein
MPYLTSQWVGVFWRPSIVALLSYATYVGWLLASNQNDATIFAYIGSFFADRGGPVTEIVHEIGFGPPYWGAGFDGQFYYYIALDPFNAWQMLDTVARYQRILYPLLVRLLSLGILPLVPYLMIAVNLAFVAIGTEILAKLLKLHQLNPWYSVGYAFCMGQLVCLRRDLPEPIMCALILAAIYLINTRGISPLAGLFFSLALFTKEPAMLFVVPYLIWALASARKDRMKMWTFAAVSVLPYSLYQSLLFYRFGLVAFFGIGNLQTLTWLPFYGMFQMSRPIPELVSMTTMIAVPAIAALVLFLRGVVQKTLDPLVMALFLNGVFLIFLPPPSYLDVFTYSRVSLGLVVAWLTYAAITRSRRMLAYSVLWTVPFQFSYLLWLI